MPWTAISMTRWGRFFIRVRIGVAFWPEDGDDGDALLAAADAAMYRAKADGRGRIAFYAEH